MIHMRKRLSVLLLCFLLLTGAYPADAYGAPDWPSDVSIQAEGGIVMDAATGTVLWGQNIHTPYFPASITKIMTALLVIENCSMDEIVTFSHNAVFNVEVGSSNAGINEGDKLSVKDCLYALLLKSANESANALAEHVAGTTEAFAEMMNVKAKELGCRNTLFNNPSGLNDPQNTVSPYDMALIARAAFNNPVFEEIDSTTYYKLPPNSINTEGLTIYPGHKMLKKSTPYYYPGIIGGKTGYTSLAGNTLVTCAEKNGMRLIAVILNGSTPQYWTDTKNLLDFGFENFESVKASDYDSTYGSVTNDLNIGNLGIEKPAALVLDSNSTIILPKTAQFSDTDSVLTYDISKGDPENAIAKILYRYNDREVGCTYLEINSQVFGVSAANGRTADDGQTEDGLADDGQIKDGLTEDGLTVDGQTEDGLTADGLTKDGLTDTAQNETGQAEDGQLADSDAGTAPVNDSSLDDTAPSSNGDSEFGLKPFDIPPVTWAILIGAVLLIAAAAGIILFFYLRGGREDHSYLLRHEQRMKRLQDSGISADEFNILLEQRRSSYTTRKKGRRNKHLKFK